MAGLTISLGRCGFCGAAASRASPLVGDSSRPARVCKQCVSRLRTSPPAARSAASLDENRTESIRRFEREIETDPDNVRARLKLGDLYLKRGASPKAITQYEIVAAKYARDGAHLKAVVVYKMILRLDERRTELRQTLGELYEQLGMPSEAISQYAIAAREFDAQSLAQRALVVLRKLAALDPENILVRQRIAQLDPAASANANAEEPAAVLIDLPEPSSQVSATEVLEKFRRGVEAQVGREDLRARFDLGTAYKEKIADARAQYRIAAEQFRREGDDYRARACEIQLVALAVAHVETEQPERKCSFCDKPADPVRPPARLGATVLCADCLLEAQTIFIN